MAGFGGVHEEGRRAGRGQGRGKFARDVARLAEPGDDDAALGLADQVDRFRECRPKRALQRGRERRDPLAAGLERAQRRLDGGVGVVAG